MSNYPIKILFVCILLLFSVETVFAHFSVEPSKIEGRMPAGKTYENAFIVSNRRDTPFTVLVTWTDKTIRPLSHNWLTFKTTEQVVPPRGSIKIPIKITLPENASGEYNARVIFSQKTDPTMGNPIAIRYNYPIYIAVTGTEKHDFAIQNIRITNKKNTELTISMYNKGNVHIRPKGTISVTCLDNDTAKPYTFIFNKNAWGILPEELFPYKCKLKEVSTLPNGKYEAHIMLQAGPADNRKSWQKKFMFQIDEETGSILE